MGRAWRRRLERLEKAEKCAAPFDGPCGDKWGSSVLGNRSFAPPLGLLDERMVSDPLRGEPT